MNRMKCTRCRAYADFANESHNAKYCAPCFKDHFLNQTSLAIEEQGLFNKNERILVAISGGKDSLGLWSALINLGYEADGIHVNLGFDEDSEKAQEVSETFAENNGLNLFIFDLKNEIGCDLLKLRQGTGKPACAVCGLVKRYIINGTAKAGGYDCVATGHNLDDETAKLLSNILRWRTHHLAHQSPLLEETESFVRKAKPFYRLDQSEIRYWAKLEEIDYHVKKCPHSKGATLDYHHEAMTLLEKRMPGTKRNFLFGFLAGGRKEIKTETKESTTCLSCGELSVSSNCIFCRTIKDKGQLPNFKRWWNNQFLR